MLEPATARTLDRAHALASAFLAGVADRPVAGPIDPAALRRDTSVLIERIASTAPVACLIRLSRTSTVVCIPSLRCRVISPCQ